MQGPRAILAHDAVDCIVVDSMFLGALPLALGPRRERPGLACVGVMPYASNSRDTAPFGVAFQPGTGPLRRLRNGALNLATEHVVLRDMQRFARRGWPRPARAGFPGYFVDLQPKVVDAYLQATVAGFEYPRSDLAGTVRYVGPILAPPSQSFERPAWWNELDGGRPVVHVTQGTLDNADLGRLLLRTTHALAHDNLLVVATTGGPDPETIRRDLPANVRLERFVPHDVLLPHVDVMVTNGGYGGVQQALANGVPLVVAGDSEDKPEVAARVQWSGTGINLHTGRPSPAMVGRAVRRVLARARIGRGLGRCRRRSRPPNRSPPLAQPWPRRARPTTRCTRAPERRRVQSTACRPSPGPAGPAGNGGARGRPCQIVPPIGAARGFAGARAAPRTLPSPLRP